MSNIFAQTRKSNVQNPYISVSFPCKNVFFMYFSVIFQYVFTHFFPKLARLCALNRQYQPKNKHSPQNPPKFSPQFPQFLKKSRKSPLPKFTPSRKSKIGFPGYAFIFFVGQVPPLRFATVGMMVGVGVRKS